MRILVAGAGGFIGGHLVKALYEQGYEIKAVDIKPMRHWWQIQSGSSVKNYVQDLRDPREADRAVANCDAVYNLAADMGGMGFIENNKAACMVSVLINTNLLRCALEQEVERYFFASSACVYNADKQKDPNGAALKEEDAYPAMPEDGYGWEKLFSERMCRNFYEDYGLQTRVARLHNVYGPHGTWRDGREKAPAATCRKVIEAKRDGKRDISIWGDGNQTRSFMFIDDAIKGILMIAKGDCPHPLNLGSSERVTINTLVDYAEKFAGVKLHRKYLTDMPKGVNGRSSDNTRIKQVYDWEPSTPLRVGLRPTFDWIAEQCTE